MSINNNIKKQNYSITFTDRIIKNGHEPMVIWLTGLSGSGKSTLANELQNRLFKNNKLVCVLDGDNIRLGLNKDLTFSDSDRTENIRRIAEVAKLFLNAGFIVITAFISPFKTDREEAKLIIGKDYFKEVFIKADLDICMQRDVKGLYKKVKNGEIRNFTGINSPFEEPLCPTITINTSNESIDDSLKKLLTLIK